jgi:hypothetical protein
MAQGDFTVYADGTACINDSPKSKVDSNIPSELTDQECGMAWGDVTVYADGTACISESPKSMFDHNIPSELMEQEYDAMFHEFLCSIAPLVVVPQMLPSDVTEVESKALFHESSVLMEVSVPDQFQGA